MCSSDVSDTTVAAGDSLHEIKETAEEGEYDYDTDSDLYEFEVDDTHAEASSLSKAAKGKGKGKDVGTTGPGLPESLNATLKNNANHGVLMKLIPNVAFRT